MQRRASRTTSDAARRQKPGGIPSDCSGRGAAAVLRLLSEALRRIACVAAPRAWRVAPRPADAGTAARVGSEITPALQGPAIPTWLGCERMR